MKKSFFTLLIILAFILLPVLNSLGQPPPPPPQDIPIDGGLIALLFGGVALIIKTFFSKNKNN